MADCGCAHTHLERAAVEVQLLLIASRVLGLELAREIGQKGL